MLIWCMLMHMDTASDCCSAERIATGVATQVVVLDKETFPRDKYCGDAVCTPAIRILDDMGVMKALADNNESHFADAGGFVSPSGLSYIGGRQTASSCCTVLAHFSGGVLTPLTMPHTCRGMLTINGGDNDPNMPSGVCRRVSGEAGRGSGLRRQAHKPGLPHRAGCKARGRHLPRGL